MKKLYYVFLVLVTLAVGGIVLLPKFVPVERIKQEAQIKVKEQTGRDFTIGGDVALSLWPTIALEMNDVALGNPGWARDKAMVSLGKLKVELAVAPLLKRQIEVKQFVLKNPVIHLEKNVDGKGNWEFAPSAAAPATTPSSSASAATSGLGLKLGAFRIEGGILNYYDHATGKQEGAENIDLTVSLPTLDGAMKLDGGLTYRAQPFRIRLALATLGPLMEGKATSGTLALASDKVTVDFSGTIAGFEPFLKGALKIDVPVLPGLAAWGADDPGLAAKVPFQQAHIAGNLELGGAKASFMGADISADDLKAKGDMTVKFAGKPEVVARLAMGRLVVDRFVGPQDAAADGGTQQAAEPADNGWSREPIDFSGLKSADADLTLEVAGVSFKGIDTGPSTVRLGLKNGYLNVSLSETSVLKGSFKGGATIDASKTTPDVAAEFHVKGVEIKPVLEKFAGFKKLSGTGDVEATLLTRGNSPYDLVSALTGPGSVIFRNGALEGIDLANIAQMVQKGLANMNVGEGKTEFVEMGGTFNIVNGILSNQDFKMKGPLVQATGKGTADLPKKFLNYRVEPLLTASSAVEGASGLGIPVDITGPFSALKIKPDFKAVITNVTSNPEGLKDTARQVKDQIKTLKADPAAAQDMIKGLIQGLGR